jgi:hypothetical protein
MTSATKVIYPYKENGIWVFDDLQRNLVREPFVAGTDKMIDRVVADIPDAAKGFRLTFSASPFAGHRYQLDWLREQGGGNWYRSEHWRWRNGCVRRCSYTSQLLRSTFTSDRNPSSDNHSCNSGAGRASR